MIELPNDEVLVRSLQVRLCPACGCDKYPRHTFCRACFLSLAQPLRDALYHRLGEGYQDAVQAAMHAMKVRNAYWPDMAAPAPTERRYVGRNPPAGAARRILEKKCRLDDAT